MPGTASAKWNRTSANRTRPSTAGDGTGCAGEVTVSGASITSKNRSDAVAVSLVIASSQPMESIGQRRPIATPKKATRVPAVSVPSATWVMPITSAVPSAISGSAMIAAHSTLITFALRSSVPRSSPASRRNDRPRCALRPKALRIRMPSTDSSTVVARSPTWSCERRASTWYLDS